MWMKKEKRIKVGPDKVCIWTEQGVTRDEWSIKEGFPGRSGRNRWERNLCARARSKSVATCPVRAAKRSAARHTG